jgi:uncharacterized glyoxalase superfamily protein PhnB
MISTRITHALAMQALGHGNHAVVDNEEVIRELCDTDYGSREYGAKDTEGNSWFFGT